MPLLLVVRLHMSRRVAGLSLGGINIIARVNVCTRVYLSDTCVRPSRASRWKHRGLSGKGRGGEMDVEEKTLLAVNIVTSGATHTSSSHASSPLHFISLLRYFAEILSRIHWLVLCLSTVDASGKKKSEKAGGKMGGDWGGRRVAVFVPIASWICTNGLSGTSFLTFHLIRECVCVFVACTCVYASVYQDVRSGRDKVRFFARIQLH